MIAFILDILFFGFCHWLGQVAVKVITLGKVDLSHEDPSEFFFLEWIGVGVLLVIAMLISFLINAKRDQSSNAGANKQPLSMVARYTTEVLQQPFGKPLKSIGEQGAWRGF
jgi:hypothetical protein